MNGLEMPATAPSSAVQRHEAVAEQVRPGTVTAVIVIRRGSQRDVRQSQFLVHAGHGPQIRAPTPVPGIAAPCFVAELAGMGNRMESPAQLAGVDVVAPHIAAGAAWRPVRYQTADNQRPGALRDGRCQAVAPREVLWKIGWSGVQDTVICEFWIQLAGLAVNGKERPSLAAEQQALRIALLPVAEPAVDVQVETP